MHVARAEQEHDSGFALPDAAFSKARALLARGEYSKGVGALRLGVRSCGSEDGLVQLREIAKLFSSSWLAQYWAGLIVEAEVPNPLSSRDGKLLRLVPLEKRLARKPLADNLSAVIIRRLRHDCDEMFCQACVAGKVPGRAQIALMRAYAYCESGNFDQAQKDARAAMAYGPKSGTVSTWPRAHAALSSAIDGKQDDNTQAALEMQKAAELEPGCLEYAADLERLMRRIPERHADALQAGGSAALEALLRKEADDALPEFLKPRPKYYYYYKWMRQRVLQHCGELPGPVMDKLLTLDATELDMLLTYPSGIKQQALRLTDVYESKGEEVLSTYRLPLLTWKESQELKSAHQAALEAASGPKKLSIEERMMQSIAAAHSSKKEEFESEIGDADGLEEDDEDFDALD